MKSDTSIKLDTIKYVDPRIKYLQIMIDDANTAPMIPKIIRINIITKVYKYIYNEIDYFTLNKFEKFINVIKPKSIELKKSLVDLIKQNNVNNDEMNKYYECYYYIDIVSNLLYNL